MKMCHSLLVVLLCDSDFYPVTSLTSSGRISEAVGAPRGEPMGVAEGRRYVSTGTYFFLAAEMMITIRTITTTAMITQIHHLEGEGFSSFWISTSVTIVGFSKS